MSRPCGSPSTRSNIGPAKTCRSASSRSSTGSYLGKGDDLFHQFFNRGGGNLLPGRLQQGAKYKNGDLVIVQAIYKEQGRLFTSDKKFLEDEIKIFLTEIKLLMQVNFILF